MTGLYVHIPFCAARCRYCDFVSTAFVTSQRKRAFLEAFAKEAAARRASCADVVFDTLYLGGGTPSLLGTEEIAEVVGAVRKCFTFAPDAETTLEANPGDLDEAKAAALKGLGVGRISLGAQSFHDGSLERLGRRHRAADIADSFRTLRGAGFSNINVDLMLSLPGEGSSEAVGSLRRAVELSPEHVSLYELEVHPKTVFGAWRAKGRLELPDEDLSCAILTGAREYLQAKGYEHYELLNYAKAGFRSKHNQIYWTGGSYLGLGPGAVSFMNGRRSKLAGSFEGYVEKVSRGDLSNVEEECLEPFALAAEAFILRLRLTEGAEMEEFAAVLDVKKEKIAELQGQGLLEAAGERIRLTERGLLFAETVFSELA